VSVSETVKAIAVAPGYSSPSAASSATYTINLTPPLALPNVKSPVNLPGSFPFGAQPRCSPRLPLLIPKTAAGVSIRLTPFNPDHHFIIDRHPDHANVILFSCCSGHGFKYAPAYGTIALDLVAGKQRDDLAALGIKPSGNRITRYIS
jgi:hypothetical protein